MVSLNTTGVAQLHFPALAGTMADTDNVDLTQWNMFFY